MFSSHFCLILGGTELLQAVPTLIGSRAEKPSLRSFIPSLCVSSMMRIKQTLPTVHEGGRDVQAADMTAPHPSIYGRAWTVSWGEHQSLPSSSLSASGRQMGKLRPRRKEEDEKSRKAFGAPQGIEGSFIKRKKFSENLNIFQICLW